MNAAAGRGAGGGGPMVRLLLLAGADCNAANQYGLTALHYAARRFSRDAVVALLEAGARPDIAAAGAGGRTPLAMLATSCADPSVADAVAIVWALRDAGARLGAAEAPGGGGAEGAAEGQAGVAGAPLRLAFGPDGCAAAAVALRRAAEDAGEPLPARADGALAARLLRLLERQRARRRAAEESVSSQESSIFALSSVTPRHAELVVRAAGALRRLPEATACKALCADEIIPDRGRVPRNGREQGWRRELESV
jgi:hypothetical protein